MNVSAIIVTRGDVDLKPVVASLPDEWEILVWNNGHRLERLPPGDRVVRESFEISDLSVYGRYAAIEHTDAELIFVQDDDCVVSEPQALVHEWLRKARNGYFGPGAHYPDPIPFDDLEPFAVCNMPPEFRHSFYTDHALVGFGACFHRDAPWRAFEQLSIAQAGGFDDWFRRTCDIVFTALTPRVLVDVPKTNLWWANDPSRMFRQEQHIAERTRMLELVKKVRDG